MQQGQKPLPPQLKAIDVYGSRFIENVRANAAPAALTEGLDELSDAWLGHQEPGRERIRTNLDQIVALLLSTDRRRLVIDEHVSQLVSK